MNNKNGKIVSFENTAKNNNSAYTPEEQKQLNELKMQENKINTEIQFRINNGTGISPELRAEILSVNGKILDIYMSKWTQDDINHLNEMYTKYTADAKKRMASYDAGMPEKAERAAVYAYFKAGETAQQISCGGLELAKKGYDDIFYISSSFTDTERYLTNKYMIPMDKEFEKYPYEELFFDETASLEITAVAFADVCFQLAVEYQKFDEGNDADLDKISAYTESYSCLLRQLLWITENLYKKKEEPK